MNRVVFGYRHWEYAACPYCGGNYGAVEDDGQSDYAYLCWCGAKARVAKDDPDIVEALKEKA